MKTLMVVLLTTVAAFAGDFPTIAHVIAANRTTIAGVSREAWKMPQTRAEGIGKPGAVSYTTSNCEVTEFQIGNMIYTSEHLNKHIVVGNDYPARIEKHKLFIFVDGKQVRFFIEGVREAK